MSAASRRKPRLLIIEDDADLRSLLRAVLEEEDYTVLSADHTLSPDDVAQLRPDLIVLDLWLDGRDGGWGFLQELKVTPGARWIPVLVCTADAELVRREAGRLEALATDVVVKPFDLDEFLGRVAAARSAPPKEPIDP